MGQLSSCFVKLARIILSWFSSPESEKFYGKAVEYYNTYLSSRNPQDLQNAYSNYQSAGHARQKEKTPAAPEGYDELLLNLGTAYYTQFSANAGANGSMDKAIEIYRELSALPGVQKVAQAKGLLMLGKTLALKCDSDKATNLGCAIDSYNNALILCNEISKSQEEKSSDLASVRVLCLYNLATAYDMRYKIGAAPEDLNEAINWNYEVRKEAPVDHPDLASCLYNLACQLFKRYQNAQGTGTLAVRLEKRKGVEDLKMAGTIAHEAKGLVPTIKAVSGLEESVDKLLAVIKEHASEGDAPEGWETVGAREG